LVGKDFSPRHITASDPSSQSLENLKTVAPVHTTQDNVAAVADADVVVMAVKPQVMKQVAEPLAAVLAERKPLIISIAAGIDCASLAQWLGQDLPVVRCMPNTPALVQTGATAL